MNKALNLVRLEEVKRVDSLKKSKYIWLKNEAKLTENQASRLEEYLSDSTLNTSIELTKLKINLINYGMYNHMQLNQR